MASQYRSKRVRIAAASLAGIVVGASGMGVLHATTATAPAFFVGNTQEVLDADLFKQYQAAAGKTGARYGARVIALGAPSLIDAQSTLPKGTVIIIQFPSMKDLQAWWNSPEYSAVRPMREKSTVGQNYVIEGVPTP